MKLASTIEHYDLLTDENNDPVHDPAPLAGVYGSINNIELICGDFATTPFCRNFDVVYSSLTFLHIEDKQGVINKGQRF